VKLSCSGPCSALLRRREWSARRLIAAAASLACTARRSSVASPCTVPPPASVTRTESSRAEAKSVTKRASSRVKGKRSASIGPLAALFAHSVPARAPPAERLPFSSAVSAVRGAPKRARSIGPARASISCRRSAERGTSTPRPSAAMPATSPATRASMRSSVPRKSTFACAGNCSCG
jgi:hypothetical protein